MEGKDIYIKWVLFFLGLIGNLIGFFVFSSKSMRTFSTRNIFRAVAIVNVLFLVYLISIDLSAYFNFKLFLSCKMLWHLTFAFASVNTWLLIFLTVEKYISIQFTKNQLFKNTWFQLISFLAILTLNIVYFVPDFWRFNSNETEDTSSSSSSSSTSSDHETVHPSLSPSSSELETEHEIEKENQYTSDHSKNFLQCSLYDQSPEFNSILKEVFIVEIVPFLIMLLVCGLLVHAIFKFRLKIENINVADDKQKLKNLIRLAVSAIILDAVKALFALPIHLNDVQQSYKTNRLMYDLTMCFFYSSFAFHFYILFVVNSIFRGQVFAVFKAQFNFSKVKFSCCKKS